MTDFFVGEEVRIDGGGFVKLKEDKVYIISKIEDKFRNGVVGEGCLVEFVTEVIDKETRERIPCCITPIKLKHARVQGTVNKDSKKSEQVVAKPILEERKKDKVRMELVDQGFPNALLELAKVMTWANQNKGYKDHDWKNIPNAENAFKGAAARHRVKFDAQRSFGNEMLDCTDEESGIIHLAHELFNTMALLELALAGKVK